MTELITAMKANDHSKVIEIMGREFLDTEETDESGNTPLHIAAQQNWVEAAQHLVMRGADINRRNKFGATPLYFAAKFGGELTTQYLLDIDADPHIANQNNVTPQDIASHSGHTRVAKLIGAVAVRKKPQGGTDHMLQNILKRKKA